MDGSDGGRGGRPASVISVSTIGSRLGTATNKTSVSSTLMCGSNSCGEPLPLHIMFSSKAEKEENYQVNAEWRFDLPRVFVQFGHPAPRSFPSTVTVKSKGGTDSRVLQQVLLSYVESLYPDAKDEAGCRVII